MGSLSLIIILVSSLFLALIWVSVYKYKEARININLFSFLRYLVIGKGYDTINYYELNKKLDSGQNGFLLTDLRTKKNFEKKHIPDAVSIHFDDLIRELVIEEKYKDEKDKAIIVVCDTGHMSRVAASILVEEGYTNVYNLKGGMRKWKPEMECSCKLLTLAKNCC